MGHNGSEQPEWVKLPPVVIEFKVDDEQGIRLAVAEQNWWNTKDGMAHKTEIMLPVADGFDVMNGGAIEVMLPDSGARRYIIKFMNMKAKRMIAAGFKPRLKTQLESAMMDFATPIDKNGNGVAQ